MRIEEIRDALRRQPFRQFAFRLADAPTLDVPHPEFVAIASPRMIASDQQLQNTIEKLARLEKYYAEAKERPVDNPQAREQSLRSLKRMMNQLKEEVVRYRSHAKAGKGL